jgi:hypothetical protein
MHKISRILRFNRLWTKKFFFTSYIYLKKCDEVRFSKYKSKWGGGGGNKTYNFL